MNDNEWVTACLVVIMLILMVFARGCDDCRPADQGVVHVSRLRSDRIEVCNGSKWVQLKVQEVKP